MTEWSPPETRRLMPLLIAFCDFTRFAARAEREPAEALADALDDYYRRVWRAVSGSGGRVVKFIGDGALIVYPAERADDGVRALLALAREADAWFEGMGWDSRLIVRIHLGEAVIGPFGPPDAARIDVIGAAVNIAATVRGRGVVMTQEAFAGLAPDTRALFAAHAPPTIYVRTGDRAPHRTGRDV